jgi:hypothetical protein
MDITSQLIVFQVQGSRFRAKGAGTREKRFKVKK